MPKNITPDIIELEEVNGVYIPKQSIKQNYTQTRPKKVTYKQIYKHNIQTNKALEFIDGINEGLILLNRLFSRR